MAVLILYIKLKLNKNITIVTFKYSKYKYIERCGLLYWLLVTLSGWCQTKRPQALRPF